VSRRPTSDEAKHANGTYRPSTARNTISLPLGTPAAPKWLECEAKTEWERIVPHLSAARALSETDRSVLASYCVLWGQFERARGDIPAARITQMRLLMIELGITPKSRPFVRALQAEEPAQPPQPANRRVVSIAELLGRKPNTD
jgi:phage terminase small subunit